jgi:hypothetical protein
MMRAMKTYSGGCHCGKVRYRATTDLARVTECNCSHCEKVGYLLTFVSPEHFTLESGQNELIDYQFNRHLIHHTFCKSCGVKAFATGSKPTDGSPVYAVNVRCLDGVDLTTITRTPFDGRKL